MESLEPRQLLAADVQVVKDIQTAPVDYDAKVAYFAELNDVVYFAAKPSATAPATLWKTDGTAAGTQMVVDILQGGGPLDPEGFWKFNGSLYFTANDGVHGRELWKSDGTAAGTKMVIDLYPGKASSGAGPVGIAGGKLFFTTASGSLCVTDGTEAGTTSVQTPSGVFRGGVGVVGDLFMFRFNDGVHGNELWKSDGTVAGTALVKDIQPGAVGSNVQYWEYGGMAAVGGVLFFAADDGVHGTELWKSDGTAAGTVLVKDIRPGAQSQLFAFANINGVLLFAANNGIAGHELWRSDGTEAGTFLVEDIHPGPNSSYISIFRYVVNGSLYFSAGDGVHGRQLWKSDGTAAGTFIISDLEGGGGVPNELFVTAVGDVAYFNGLDAEGGGELWKTDGTAEGTTKVKDFGPGSHTGVLQMVGAGGKLFFTALNRFDLWVTDGTTNGTEFVRDMRVGTQYSNPTRLTLVGDVTYFVAQRGFDLQIWKTDGTEAGTVQVTNFPINDSRQLHSLVNVGGVLFFVDSNSAAYTLYKIDETSGGAVALGVFGYLSLNLMVVVGDDLYFSYDDGVHGRELWKSDGTPEGTALVKDINPTGNSNPGSWVVVDETLYFSANNGANGTEVWKTDGTAAGTLPVTNFSFAATSIELVDELNGWIFFFANDGVSGNELWKTNGTATGTLKAYDLNPGPGSSGFYGASIKVNNLLYFVAADPIHYYELWRTDGTGGGTFLVRDIWPGNSASGASGIEQMINANGVLYFIAEDGVHGREVWKSDGTGYGTVMVKDVWPSSGKAKLLSNIGSTVYFVGDAVDGATATIWQTDGTEAGTVAVTDINPNSSSNGDPANLISDGGKLFFSATGDIVGRELWVLRPDLSGDYNDDGVVDGADFLAWQRGYGTIATPVGSGADGDGDGTVDADDLGMWVDHFGEPAASAASQVSAAAALVAAEETELGVDSLAVIVAESARSETARDALFAAGDLSRLFAADRDANEEWLTRRRGRGMRGR